MYITLNLSVKKKRYQKVEVQYNLFYWALTLFVLGPTPTANTYIFVKYSVQAT